MLIVKFQSTMDKMDKDPKCSTEETQFTYNDSEIGMVSNFTTITLKVRDNGTVPLIF